MYISPINVLYKTPLPPIVEEIQREADAIAHKAVADTMNAVEKDIADRCLKVAYEWGIDINKEDLIAALKADRRRYEEAYDRGYSAGRCDALSELEAFKNTGMLEVPNDDKL